MSRIPESDPHKAAIQAISRRLRQLYPPAHVRIRENKQLGRMELRPDIYIEHRDGRYWAYEIVHGNTTGLKEKHDAYTSEGINDIWIVSDRLIPKRRQNVSIDQGVILPPQNEEKLNYHLSKPQLELLEMQQADPRYLYAFTVNTFKSQEARTELSEFLQMISMGFEIYWFTGWGQKRKTYPAESDFVSIAEATFDDMGKPMISARQDEHIEQLVHQMGIFSEGGFILSEVLAKTDKIFKDPQELKRLGIWHLVYSILSLPLTEQTEVLNFFSSGKVSALPRFRSSLTEVDVVATFNSSNGMSNSLEKLNPEISRLQGYFDTTDLPAPLKRIIMSLMKPKSWENSLEFMKWQAESKALRGARRQLEK